MRPNSNIIYGLVILGYFTQVGCNSSDENSLLFSKELIQSEYVNLLENEKYFHFTFHKPNNSCSDCIFESEYLFSLLGDLSVIKNEVYYSYGDYDDKFTPLFHLSAPKENRHFKTKIFNGTQFREFEIQEFQNSPKDKYHILKFTRMDTSISEQSKYWDEFNFVIYNNQISGLYISSNILPDRIIKVLFHIGKFPEWEEKNW